MFRVDIFNLPNMIVNYAHVLSRGGLVGGNNNFIILKMEKVSKILQVGMFQIPIDIVDVEVGIFHNNFSIALVHQNNNLLM